MDSAGVGAQKQRTNGSAATSGKSCSVCEDFGLASCADCKEKRAEEPARKRTELKALGVRSNLVSYIAYQTLQKFQETYKTTYSNELRLVRVYAGLKQANSCKKTYGPVRKL